MKTKLFISAALFGVVGAANAATLASWTFETSQPTTAGPFNAEVGTGQASGSHVGAAVYSSPAGNGSAHSFSSNTWAVGDFYQFKVSTTGFAGLSFTFDQTSSNTGPRDFQVQYSTNGTTFTNFGSIYAVLANGTPNPAWNATTSNAAYTKTVNLSSISALNNQANVWLRVTDASTVSANGSTVATAGTNRLDNVTVAATAVPEPASMAVLGLGAAALIRRRKKA